MIGRKKTVYLAVVLCFVAAVLTFRPGLWLAHKPASTQNSYYTQGWQDGCTSGTNSYSLLYAPLLEKPFVKELNPVLQEEKSTSAAGEYYRSGWNEGFTLCRYYQASVYELMQFAIVIATLLFIGYLLSRKQRVS